MSGAIAATTIAALSAGIGAASLGYGIYEGKQQNAAQATALKKQNTAQQTATAAALSTERKSEVAQDTANQQTPDLAGILRRAVAGGGGGLSSTTLTGSSGVNPASLSLGKTSLLGA